MSSSSCREFSRMVRAEERRRSGQDVVMEEMWFAISSSERFVKRRMEEGVVARNPRASGTECEREIIMRLWRRPVSVVFRLRQVLRMFWSWDAGMVMNLTRETKESIERRKG